MNNSPDEHAALVAERRAIHLRAQELYAKGYTWAEALNIARKECDDFARKL